MGKKRLTIHEWNVINRLSANAKCDWFWLDTDPKTDEDYVIDLNEDERLTIASGILLLNRRLKTKDLKLYGLTPREIEIYNHLILKIKTRQLGKL